MSAQDDEAMLDAIEENIMHKDVSVELKRCWVNCGRPTSWQVSFKANATGDNGKVFCAGGGMTLREALQSAFTNMAVERLS